MISHTMEYYSALKRTEILIDNVHKPQKIMLSERHRCKRKIIVWFLLCEVPRLGKFTETEK